MVNHVLALDTSTHRCAIGLGRWPAGAGGGEPEVLAEYNLDAPRAAMSVLLPAAKDLLSSAGLTFEDLGVVVAGRGPGSFTGVRIGVATAKGLAQGLAVPLFGVGTPDAVAWRFIEHEGLVGIVGDAMRGEVYPTLFECGGGVARRLGTYRVALPEHAAETWACATEAPVLLAGDGLAKHAEVFLAALGRRGEIAPPELWGPTGSSLLGAAWQEIDYGQEAAPGALLPVYTRLSDAEENERRRSGGTPESGVAGPGGAR